MKDYLRILRNQKYPARFLLSRVLMTLGISKYILINRHGYRSAVNENLIAVRDVGVLLRRTGYSLR